MLNEFDTKADGMLIQIGNKAVLIDEKGFVKGKDFFDHLQQFGTEGMKTDAATAVYGEYWLEDKNQKIYLDHKTNRLVSIAKDKAKPVVKAVAKAKK